MEEIWITVSNSRPKSNPSLNVTISIATTARLQKKGQFFFKEPLYLICAFIFACYGITKDATKWGVYVCTPT